MTDDQEKPREAVILGGSAGSLEALQQLLPQLPLGYELAVIIVLHQFRHAGKHLASVLAARSRLPVQAIQDKDPISPGKVWVCPANYHLLIESDRTFALSTDPPVNYARPSIDVVFESAARVYRERLVGVLLSGTTEDGAAGLRAITTYGGQVVCQDPAIAVEPTMPRAGLSAAAFGWVGSPEAIGIKLGRLHL